MGNLDALFADLLRAGGVPAASTHGDNGDSGDKRLSARVCERATAGDVQATNGDIGAAGVGMSPLVASVSPPTSRPESKHWRGSSPMSPLSPSPPQGGNPPPPRSHCLARADADRCLMPAWDGVEITRFEARRARLIRWGYTSVDADVLAERLTLRDRGADDRHMCTECRRCKPGLTCGAHRAAGVGRELGQSLACTLQRCPCFAPIDGDPVNAVDDRAT